MKKVLIVDDEENVLHFLGKALRVSGLEVLTAGKIEEAEYAIKNTFFDVVIADVRLTGVLSREGLELIDFVRQNARRTKVIIITGYGSDQIEDEAYERGAALYLEKPFDLNIIREKLTEMGVIGPVETSGRV